MRKVTTLILVMVLALAALAGCSNSGGKSVGGVNITDEHFDTPEKAIEYFVSGIAENDLDKALSASAVNEAGAGFDFTQNAKRTDTIFPMNMNAPADYDFFAQVNSASMAGSLAAQVKGFCYGFFYEDELNQPAEVESEDAIGDFIKAVDPAALKELQVKRIDAPYPDAMEKDEVKDALAATAAVYGAQEATERIALFDLDGKLYWGGFTLLQYNGNWKICTLQSMVVNQAATGAVEKTTEDAYIIMTE